MHGLTSVIAGEARVVQLFGRYRGSIRAAGLHWVNPFARRRRVSTRIRNHETPIAKVNDAEGNPIEIAAVVVWRVEDTAKAIYAVDDFVQFVATQTETAVRHTATRYAYDTHGSGALSLRDNADEITQQLSAEIARRALRRGRPHWSSPGSPGCPMPPRSPRPCCASRQRPRWSVRDSGSCRVRSAWSSWR